VRFPDGTSHVCEQEEDWRPFVHDREELEWCTAQELVRSQYETLLVVRRRGCPHPLIGSSLPTPVSATEHDARTVVDAFGGTSRFRDGELGIRRAKAALAASPFPIGFLSDREVTSFLSQQYRVPMIDLDAYEVGTDVIALVSLQLCERHGVLPVSVAGRSLIVAMTDPTDDAAKDELSAVTGYEIEPVIASETAIRKAIHAYYTRHE
jgi:hypothetical protein